MLCSKIIMAAIAVLIGVSVAQATDESYSSENAARDCIHKRLAELISQNNRNITADATLTMCAKGLQSEMEKKGKSECEAKDYTGWIIRHENSKINGLSGQPYKPDKTFLAHCRKTEK